MITASVMKGLSMFFAVNIKFNIDKSKILLKPVKAKKCEKLSNFSPWKSSKMYMKNGFNFFMTEVPTIENHSIDLNGKSMDWFKYDRDMS